MLGGLERAGVHGVCCVERLLQRTTSRPKGWLEWDRRVRRSLVAASRTRLAPQIFGPDRVMALGGQNRGFPQRLLFLEAPVQPSG